MINEEKSSHKFVGGILSGKKKVQKFEDVLHRKLVEEGIVTPSTELTLEWFLDQEAIKFKYCGGYTYQQLKNELVDYIENGEDKQHIYQLENIILKIELEAHKSFHKYEISKMKNKYCESINLVTEKFDIMRIDFAKWVQGKFWYSIHNKPPVWIEDDMFKTLDKCQHLTDEEILKRFLNDK